MLDVRRLKLLRGTSAARNHRCRCRGAVVSVPPRCRSSWPSSNVEAGVPLLERTGRRVRLTPAGENLARHAEAILQRLEQASGELVDARRGLAGAAAHRNVSRTAARAILPAALIALVSRASRVGTDGFGDRPGGRRRRPTSWDSGLGIDSRLRLRPSPHRTGPDDIAAVQRSRVPRIE